MLRQDLRYAIRVLAASPGFTAVAVLSLALGIGANAAIFSLLNSVRLSTLPVPHPETLVMVTDPAASGVSVGMESGERSLLTYAEFRQLQDAPGIFASLMASQSSLSRIEARLAGGAPEEIAVRLVSSSYFDTLGVSPALGRAFDARREAPAGSAPYAVISHEFWRRRFGGRPDVLGRTIAFRSGVLSIIGVAPASFFGETVGERPDAWVPLAMQAVVMPGRDRLHDEPGSVEKVMWLHAFGRLRPNVAIEQAQARANIVFQQGLAAYYGGMADQATRKQFLNQRLRVRDAATGASSLRDDFSEPLVVLLVAAAFVLLIACSNLGNLLLARATVRSREMAVRLALGAGRGRLVRQLLTESSCLALAGGVIGLGAAVLMRQALLRLVPDTVALPAAMGWRVLAFVFVVTLAAGMLLGLLPALRITKAEAAAGLRDQGRGIAGSAVWLRVGKAVVVGQLALSLPLLVGAGLLVQTLANLQRVEVGYPKDDLITVRIDARAAGYDFPRQAAAFETLLARIRAVPGVRAATYSNNGLFGGSDNGDAITVEGYTPTGRDDGGSRYDAVGPRYFSTLGIPVLVGREITEQDVPGGQSVCVVNETFAKRFFKDRNPIGLHVTQQYADESHTYEVVGVVRDSRQNRLRGEIEHRFYTPATQPAARIDAITFVARAAGDVASVQRDIRAAVQQAEPAMTIGRLTTVGEAMDERMVQDRLLARLSIALGLVALLLSSIGLYGVLSYGVARRTSEIGIRKALGAQDGALVAMILRETGWLFLAGVAAGAALSAATLRLIANRLYGLTPTDPLAFAAAASGLAVVAIVAAWMPAYRASRVDPLVALRHE